MRIEATDLSPMVRAAESSVRLIRGWHDPHLNTPRLQVGPNQREDLFAAYVSRISALSGVGGSNVGSRANAVLFRSLRIWSYFGDTYTVLTKGFRRQFGVPIFVGPELLETPTYPHNQLRSWKVPTSRLNQVAVIL